MLSRPSNEGEPTVTLSDPTLEHGSVIRNVLDMITHRKFCDIKSTTVTELEHMMRFAQKYECSFLFKTLMLLFEQFLVASTDAYSRREDAIHVFMAAARLDQIIICQRAIEAGEWRVWPQTLIYRGAGSEQLDLGAWKHGEVFDMANLGLSAFREMPPDYLWAMLRAIKGRSDPKERAAAFGRLMNSIKKYDKDKAAEAAAARAAMAQAAMAEAAAQKKRKTTHSDP